MLSLLLPLSLLGPAHAERALFLGNSFTFDGQLDQATLALLQEGAPSWADGEATRLAEGGLTLSNHLSKVETAGTDWAAALAAEGVSWDWVVLQDQSQIPGFPATQADYRASLAAAPALDAYAEARGAQTLFFLTWGYRAGDETNPELFPDFETMQERLKEGYAAYRDAASEGSQPAWIAPVGPAYALAWEREVAAGADPLATDSRFYRLYDEDGRHPSTLGTYLAACVFYATMTGSSPVGLSGGALTDPDDVLWAQTLAADTVFDSTLGYSYPWSGSAETGEPDTGEPDTGDPDTGEPDTGDPDTGDPDTGDPDTGAPSETGDPAQKEGGCGCATGREGSSLGMLAALLGGLAARRGRRSP